MPARIVVVFDDPAFLEPLVAALGRAGHDVVAFDDPVAALASFPGPIFSRPPFFMPATGIRCRR